jgi:subtilisin family serine protease
LDSNGNEAEFSVIEDVNVWAPGLEIYSTYKNNLYTTMDGTSMAAPHWTKYLLSY